MKLKIKPRNPFVALAKFRKAGSHEKPAKSLRRQEKQILAKTAKQSPESWRNRIFRECGSAMAPADSPVPPAPTSPQGAGRHAVAVPSNARDWAKPNTFLRQRQNTATC